MPNSKVVVDFKGVHFSYKSQMIFRDFNFQIETDQLISLIGVNGSGKSTFLKLILGLLKPNSGEIQLLGLDPQSLEVRSQLGIALQDIDFPSQIRVIEILKFVCTQFKNSYPLNDLVEDFSLTDFQNKFCSQLSGGMKRRLALACAFAGKPKVVLLDEPSTGLDVQSRKQLISTLKKYQKNQKALVIMISHYPTEIIESVDHFYLLKNGQIEIISRERMGQMKQVTEITFQTDSDLSHFKNIQKKGNLYRLVSTSSDDDIRELCEKKINFNNLRVNPLDSESLIEEMF